MRYKTLFRLGVKLLGLVFIVIYGVKFVQGVGLFVWEFFYYDQIPNSRRLIEALLHREGRFGSTWVILLGLYLFFRGSWIVNLAIPSNRPYCPECGFDLTGQPKVAVCSECGTGIPADVQAQIKKTTGSADERIPPESEEP